MLLQIISPEKVIFDNEVEAVTLPGKNGQFQILNNHAPIVSTLDTGTIKIKLAGQTKGLTEFQNTGLYTAKNSNELLLDVKGGVIEMSNNKVIVLAS